MIEDSDFMYNKAVINGGAIYTDQLDVYDIQIRNTTFDSNLGGLYGDNIYAK
jgi:predicted outer membrane repeat protein